MFDLNGKTALVTGGGSGIGKAIVERLASDGYQVAVVDLNPGDAPHSYAVDVTDRCEPAGKVRHGTADRREHTRADRLPHLLVANVDLVKLHVAPAELTDSLDRNRRAVRKVVDNDDRPAGLEQYDRGMATDVAGPSGQ